MVRFPLLLILALFIAGPALAQDRVDTLEPSIDTAVAHVAGNAATARTTLTKKDWIDVVEVFVNGWESGRRKWTRSQIESASGVSFRTMAELFRGAPEWQTYFRGADGNDKPRLWELNIGTPEHIGAAQSTDATPVEPEIA